MAYQAELEAAKGSGREHLIVVVFKKRLLQIESEADKARYLAEIGERYDSILADNPWYKDQTEQRKRIAEQRKIASGRGRRRREPRARAQAESLQGRSRKKQPTGFDGLPKQKLQDLSGYFDAANLTRMQRDCLSLRFEYGLPVSEIARRLGKHRSTIQEALKRGERRVGLSRSAGAEGVAKRRAVTDPGSLTQ